MFLAYLYKPLYLALVAIITIIVSSKYKMRDGRLAYSSNLNEINFGWVLAFTLSLFIGLRPVSTKYFCDMANYVQSYEAFYEGTSFQFDWHTSNILFDNLFHWFGSMQLGYTSFFLLISIIYFCTSYIACKKIFPNDTLISYLVILGAFSTFSYATNGIKGGAAASIFLLALAYRENLKVCIPLALISLGFHHAMILPIVSFLLAIVYRNYKVYFAFWCFCFIMSAAHVTIFQNLFSGFMAETMNDLHGATYLQNVDGEWGGKSGFRVDFILYSVMPVLVGYWSIYKKKMILSKFYICLLNVYLCANGIWMLCMYAEFTNRIAYLSWFLYPMILIYPFLNENWGVFRYNTFSKVTLIHLGFTIFMEVFYYGLIR